MLRREAEWLGRHIERLDRKLLFPLLNVGSSTRRFREIEQPWIDERVFRPLTGHGHVIHFDLKAADGVDVVGDLHDPTSWAKVAAMGPRSILCSNLLEHVTDREGLCQRMLDLVPEHGYLILSVPNAFPYHPDPIDTLFRPTVDELTALFPGTVRVAAEVVPCGRLLVLVEGNLLRLLAKAARMLLPQSAPVAPDPATRRESLSEWIYPWAFRQFRTTCVVLQKGPDHLSAAGRPM